MCLSEMQVLVCLSEMEVLACSVKSRVQCTRQASDRSMLYTQDRPATDPCYTPKTDPQQMGSMLTRSVEVAVMDETLYLISIALIKIDLELCYYFQSPSPDPACPPLLEPTVPPLTKPMPHPSSNICAHPDPPQREEGNMGKR